MRIARWILGVVLVSLPLSAHAGSVFFGSGVIDSVVDGFGFGRIGGPLGPNDVVAGAAFDFSFDVASQILEVEISDKPFLSLMAGFRTFAPQVRISGINANGPFLEIFSLGFSVPTEPGLGNSFAVEVTCPTCLAVGSPRLEGRVLSSGIRGDAAEPTGLALVGLLAMAAAALHARRTQAS